MFEPKIVIISYRASYYDRCVSRTLDSDLQVCRFDSPAEVVDYMASRIRKDLDAPMVNVLAESLEDLVLVDFYVDQKRGVESIVVPHSQNRQDIFRMAVENRMAEQKREEEAERLKRMAEQKAKDEEFCMRRDRETYLRLKARFEPSNEG